MRSSFNMHTIQLYKKAERKPIQILYSFNWFPSPVDGSTHERSHHYLMVPFLCNKKIAERAKLNLPLQVYNSHLSLTKNRQSGIDGVRYAATDEQLFGLRWSSYSVCSCGFLCRREEDNMTDYTLSYRPSTWIQSALLTACAIDFCWCPEFCSALSNGAVAFFSIHITIRETHKSVSLHMW